MRCANGAMLSLKNRHLLLKELQMEVNDAVADNQLREFALEQRENSVKRHKALNDENQINIENNDYPLTISEAKDKILELMKN